MHGSPQRRLPGGPGLAVAVYLGKQASALGHLGVQVVGIVQGHGFRRMRHAHRAELQFAMVAQDQVLQVPLQRLLKT